MPRNSRISGLKLEHPLHDYSPEKLSQKWQGPKIALCSLMYLSIISTLNAQTVTYFLAPGSTITVYSNNVTIGPEPVTGSFDWTVCERVEGRTCLDATRLDFESTSFSIRVHLPNNVISLIGLRDVFEVPIFDEAVDATGIASQPVELRAVYLEGTATPYPEGLYEVPLPHPLAIEMEDLRILPLGSDGPYLAALNIRAVADRDADGVPDDVDQCPNTAPGEAVDEHGCSIEQLVPCSGPAPGRSWQSHGQYVAALAQTTQAFRMAGLISKAQRQCILKAAENAECGGQ